MAKFVFALFMLFAVCGAQGNWLDTVSDKLEQIANDATGLLNNVINDYSKWLEDREENVREAQREAERIIEEWKQKVQNTANKTKDLETCVQTGLKDFEDKAKQAAEATAACADEAKTAYQQSFDEYLAAYQALKSSWEEAKDELSKCPSGAIQWAQCAAKVGFSAYGEISEDWQTLTAEGSELLGDGAKFGATWEACAIQNELSTLFDEAKAGNGVIAKCWDSEITA